MSEIVLKRRYPSPVSPDFSLKVVLLDLVQRFALAILEQFQIKSTAGTDTD